MAKYKVLKENAVVKGLDISSSFYAKLVPLVIELGALTSEDPDTYKEHMETMITLMTTIDELAENQGLTEESEVEDFPVENPGQD